MAVVRKALVVVVLLGVVGGVAYFLLRKPPSGAAATLRLSGTIEAVEVEVSPQVPGKVVEMRVDEGDLVRAGQVVAVLEGSELAAQVEQAKGAATASEAQLAESIAGPRPLEIRQAEANLTKAEAVAEGARKQVENARFGFTRSTELKQKLDAAETEHQAALAGEKAAQAALAELEAGSRPEDVQQAEAALAQAKSALDGAKVALDDAEELFRERTVDKQRVDAAETELASAQAQEQAARASLAQAQATATHAAATAERMQLLFESGAISQQERDNAATQKAVAQAAVEAADSALQRAQVAVNGATTALANARAMYEERAAAKQRLDAARTQYQVAASQYQAAQAFRDKVAHGARPEQISQARAALEKAQAAVEGSRKAVANARELYEDRLVSRQQVDAAEAEYAAGKAQVKAARAQLDLLRAGTRSERITQAKGLAEQAKGALSAAETRLGHSLVYAPVGGRVLVRAVEPGEVVNAGTPLMTIANLDTVELKVYVPETALGRVKLGQSVSVHSDTFPGKTYAGTVTFISDEAEFTPKHIQTAEERVKLVFAATVRVLNPARELKPGMPADAEIHLD